MANVCILLYQGILEHSWIDLALAWVFNLSLFAQHNAQQTVQVLIMKWQLNYSGSFEFSDLKNSVKISWGNLEGSVQTEVSRVMFLNTVGRRIFIKILWTPGTHFVLELRLNVQYICVFVVGTAWQWTFFFFFLCNLQSVIFPVKEWNFGWSNGYHIACSLWSPKIHSISLDLCFHFPCWLCLG